MDEKPDISTSLLVLLCSLIAITGISALALPHPSAWVLPSDCEYLEGTVVDKRIEDKTCWFGACTGDYILTVQPDGSDDNETIHVSPTMYHTHPAGGRYHNYLCS